MKTDRQPPQCDATKHHLGDPKQVTQPRSDPYTFVSTEGCRLRATNAADAHCVRGSKILEVLEQLRQGHVHPDGDDFQESQGNGFPSPLYVADKAAVYTQVDRQLKLCEFTLRT